MEVYMKRIPCIKLGGKDWVSIKKMFPKRSKENFFAVKLSEVKDLIASYRETLDKHMEQKNYNLKKWEKVRYSDHFLLLEKLEDIFLHIDAEYPQRIVEAQILQIK